MHGWFCSGYTQTGIDSTDVAVKTCKLDDEYETAEKFLEEARKSHHYGWWSIVFNYSVCAHASIYML